MSGGVSSFQCSWAQVRPEATKPVWTSSTMKTTFSSKASWRSARKYSGGAWRSPPSAWIGSMIMAAMSPSFSRMICRVASRECWIVSAFTAALCSSGYFIWGKGATGQSIAATSSLCMGLERVHERAPKVRPWKAPSKESTFHPEPGPRLSIDASVSSSVTASAPRPSRRRRRCDCTIMATFIAFSLAHDPHAIVCTLERPGGATAPRLASSRSLHPLGGIIPNATR
mmetsp:Transcript_3993/g.10059  ORF Transcript_3993/g.10059 Transcript_3993/m.10059 type:complete len:227 (+) Transcript_3993:569-1249(+)